MPSALNRLFAYLVSAGLGPRVIRSVAGSSALYFAGMVVTFLVGVQLARGLGTSGYGAYGIAIAVAALAGVVAELGMAKLVMREVAVASAADPPGAMRPILRWADRNSILLSLAVAVPVAGVALAVIEPGSPLQIALLWSGPYIALVALANLRGGALRGLDHVVLGQAPGLLLRPLFFSVILFAYFNLSATRSAGDAVALHALAALFVLGIAHIWLRARLPAGKATSAPEARSLWMASTLPMAMADGLKVVQAQAGILLLGILASQAETGLFKVAVSIYAVVSLPTSLANGILSPLFARLHAQGDTARLRRLCFLSAWGMLAAVALLTAPFLLYGDPLLTLVFGGDYAPALPALLILCAGTLVSAALGANAALLSMTGHERRVSRAMAYGLVVMLLLVALLVPRWQSVGAAISMAASFIIWNILLWIDARRLLGIDTSIVPFRSDHF